MSGNDISNHPYAPRLLRLTRCKSLKPWHRRQWPRTQTPGVLSYTRFSTGLARAKFNFPGEVKKSELSSKFSCNEAPSRAARILLYCMPELYDGS